MNKRICKSSNRIFLSVATLTLAFTFLFLSLTCIIVGQKKASIYTLSYTEALNIYRKELISDIAEDYALSIVEMTYPDAIKQLMSDYENSNVGISSNRYYEETTANYFEANVVYSNTFYYTYTHFIDSHYNLTLTSEENFQESNDKAYKVYVKISWPFNMTYNDIYADLTSFFEFMHMMKYMFIFIAVICFALIVATIFYMVKLNLNNPEPSNKFEYICNKPISTIWYVGAIAFISIFTLLYITQINKLISFDYERLYFGYYLGIILTATVASTIISVFLYEVLRRITERTFFNRILTVMFYNRLNLFGKGILIGILGLILLTVTYVLSINIHPAIMPVTLVGMVVLWSVFMYKLVALSNVIDSYANGDWDEYLNSNMPIICDIYKNLDKISTSMQAAVAKSIRNERTKTELITNVSHDIKTPLTSIINYTDLLKREDITDEERKQYIDTLSRNSARMKKLIEDLIEASKASTGNIELNMINCNLNTLLSQAVAEHSDNAVLNNLKIVCSELKEDILIYVDGSKLFRVFDNILSNACKYSLSGSRIYVSAVTGTDDKVNIIFKNISEAEITISPEELTERFVRGDISRHSEGSGLGLAISKNLTELMKGTLTIDIDGDLFMVTLSFPKASV